MKKMTLLQQAINTPVQRKHGGLVTDEEIELAMGWLTGKITFSQIARVIKPNSKPQVNTTSTYLFLARAIKAAYDSGILTIRK